MENQYFTGILATLKEDMKKALDNKDLNDKTKAFIRAKLEVLTAKVIPVAEKKTLTEQDVLDAQSVTCYGNLAYCCGIKREGQPGKDCPWRDAARAALHIDDKLYVQKEVVVWQLLAATSRSEQWIEENAANLPQSADT